MARQPRQFSAQFKFAIVIYRPMADDDLTVLAWIEEVLLEFPTHGVPRVTAELQCGQHLVNHKRVLHLMHANDLIQVVRRRLGTTNSRHGYATYPNLVRGLTISRPDQVWCADITYIQLEVGKQDVEADHQGGDAAERVDRCKQSRCFAARTAAGMPAR